MSLPLPDTLGNLRPEDFKPDGKIRLWLTRDDDGLAVWSDHPRRDKDSGQFHGGDVLPLDAYPAETIPFGTCYQFEIPIPQ